MQNGTFLVILSQILAEKMITAPPKEFGCRSCEVDAAIRPENPFEFPILVEKSFSISVKTFFYFLFFLRSPVFWLKNHLNFQFWLKNPSQFQINRVILIQEQ